MSLVRSVVKWAARVERADLLAGVLAKATLIATSDSPGPVYVEVPAAVGTQPTARIPGPHPVSASARSTLVAVPTLLRQSRAPVLLVGGGMRHRNQDRIVERFAERIGAAIMVTASGRGTVDENHPRFCGVAGLYAPPATAALWQEADLVVALGSRLEETAVEG